MLAHDGMAIMAAGLPALAAHLEGGGFPTRVWNLRAESASGIERDLSRDLSGVSLVGISVHWFYQIPHALDLARRAREAGFGGFIVLGGFTASLFAAEILASHPEVDGVVRGDGEVPLLDLARRLDARTRRLDRVPNLVWRSRGRIRSNPFTYVGGASEIDALDFGRLDLVEHLPEHLARTSWREITDGSASIPLDLSPTFYLCGGRGCSVACASCGGGRLAHRSHSRRSSVVFRSPSRIADDVATAMRLGVRCVHACFDPAPNGPHWHDFLAEMQKRRLRPTMIFESFGLPDEAFLAHVAEALAGAVVVISAETADEDVRSRIRGFPFTNRALESTLELIGSMGLRAQVFLGFFAPFEGMAGLHRSRSWARDLARRHGAYAEVLHYPYSTDPASPIARRPARYGMSCSLRSAADYVRGLDRRDPWLGNLLGHVPADGNPALWRAASLGIELEQACRREDPAIHSSLEHRLGRRMDRMFLAMARRLLASRPAADLERGRLGAIIRREALGEGPRP